MEQMYEYTGADESFYLTANTVLNLAKKAYEIFQISEVEEKRQLLNFLLQNPQLKGEKLIFTLKKPFDTILQVSKRSNLLRLMDEVRNIIKQRNIYIPNLNKCTNR